MSFILHRIISRVPAISLRFKTANLTINKFNSFRYFSNTCNWFSNRKYSDKHEWIVTDGKLGTVGVSHYAQDSLGDVVYIEVPEVGLKVAKDDEVGVIESVKAVSELFSPVGGTVTEVNKNLTEEPSLINTSCYDEGWIYKIEITDPSEIDSMMDEETYEKYLKSIH